MGSFSFVQDVVTAAADVATGTTAVILTTPLANYVVPFTGSRWLVAKVSGSATRGDSPTPGHASNNFGIATSFTMFAGQTGGGSIAATAGGTDGGANPANISYAINESGDLEISVEATDPYPHDFPSVHVRIELSLHWFGKA